MGPARAARSPPGAGLGIAALPASYKEPLLLTVDGLSQEALARILGTTTKAIEMRLRRARRRLADTLNGFAEK